MRREYFGGLIDSSGVRPYGAAIAIILGGCADVGKALISGAANTHCQTQPGQVFATQIACQGGATRCRCEDRLRSNVNKNVIAKFAT